MCCLLHDSGNFLRENLGRRVLSVYLPVCLRTLARSSNENSEVWTHAGVYDADVWTYYRHFLNYGVVDEYR